MTEYETTLHEFFNRRIGFKELHDGLDRAVVESPESVPAILAVLDGYYRAGDLPIQLLLSLRERIASRAGQADENARVARTGMRPRSVGSTASSAALQPVVMEAQAPPVGAAPSEPRASSDGPRDNLEPGSETRNEETGSHGRPPMGLGTVLNGRFVLEEVVARSRMGVIYRARDLSEGAQGLEVAIEVLTADHGQRTDALLALDRAKRIQGLAHPNIASVLDCDHDGGTSYVIMERLDGETLHQFMERRWLRAALAPRYARPIIEGIARALAHIHRHGIVHAGLSPETVFLTQDGGVKVLDIGTAAPVAGPDETEPDTTAPNGGMAGAWNPLYASCETLEGRKPGPRDDVYALACMAYELLAGRHPFGGLPATAARDRGIPPMPIRDLGRRQSRAILHGLALERAKRTPSVSQFLDELMSGPPQHLALSGWPLVVGSGLVGALLAGVIIILRVPVPGTTPDRLVRAQPPVSVSALDSHPAAPGEQAEDPVSANGSPGPREAAVAADRQPPMHEPDDVRVWSQPQRVARADGRHVPQTRVQGEVAPQEPVEQDTQLPEQARPPETAPPTAAARAKPMLDSSRVPAGRGEAKRSPAELGVSPRFPARATAPSAVAPREEEPVPGFGSTQIESLYKRAMRGNARAEFDLAQRYADGDGVPHDSAEAMRWFRRAAEHGSAGAQVNIGLMYAEGHGVEQDYVEAMRWFLRAAARGNADAFFNIGTLYKDGLGVPRDLDEAARWYRRAAGRGVEEAEGVLEYMDYSERP